MSKLRSSIRLLLRQLHLFYLYNRLSKREREVLRALFHLRQMHGGRHPRLEEVARIFGREAETISAHLNTILKKVDPHRQWGVTRDKSRLLLDYFMPLFVHPAHQLVVDAEGADLSLLLPAPEIRNHLNDAEAEAECEINADMVPKKRALVCMPSATREPYRCSTWEAVLFPVGLVGFTSRISMALPLRGKEHRGYLRLVLLALMMVLLAGMFWNHAMMPLKALATPQSPLVLRASRVLVGGSIVMSVAWAHEHHWLASAMADGMMLVWDGNHNWQMRPLQPVFTAYANAVAWSPNDRFIAGGDFAGHIVIWDSTTGAVVRLLAGHGMQVQSLAWSPDGSMLASASYDFTVRVWNPATGALLRTLTAHRDCATAVAWSSDSHWLATGANDDAIYLYHVPDWDHPQQLLGHTGPIRSLEWSADGRKLLSTSVDETARIWDAATGQVEHEMVHDAMLKAGIWGPGRYRHYIATVAENGHLYLWQVQAQPVSYVPLMTQDAALIERQQGASGFISDSLGSVSWSGDWIASGSLERSIILLWHVMATSAFQPPQ